MGISGNKSLEDLVRGTIFTRGALGEIQSVCKGKTLLLREERKVRTGAVLQVFYEGERKVSQVQCCRCAVRWEEGKVGVSSQSVESREVGPY